MEKLVTILFSGISAKFILQCLVSIFLGGFISFSLIFSGQTWAKSFSNITTYCLLPLIGLVITNVISGNIALSLGMVGALSIIRFRHPVKSPLELSIYFLLLTVGITITSSIGKALLLSIFSMTIVFAYASYRKNQLLKNKRDFDLSFAEDMHSYFLEISITQKNDFLANSPFLLFSNENNTNSSFVYKLCFKSKDDLNRNKEIIEDFNGIEEIKFSRI